MPRKPVWLDVDPGLDDAMGIILAAFDPRVELLGVSTCHGNNTVEAVTYNTAVLLHAIGRDDVPLYRGAAKPLTRKPSFATEYHGTNTFDSFGFAAVDRKVPGDAVPAAYAAIVAAFEASGRTVPVTIIGTAALTNVALLLSVYPTLVTEGMIDKIVVMGGAVARGNMNAAVEFNFHVDPEAAFIVLNAGVPVVLVPLELTHTYGLVSPAHVEAISPGATVEGGKGAVFVSASDYANTHAWSGDAPAGDAADPTAPAAYRPLEGGFHPHTVLEHHLKGEGDAAPSSAPGSSPVVAKAPTTTRFRSALANLLQHFAHAYASLVGMAEPPLHDPCAVFAAIEPSSFTSVRCHVDIEMASTKCAGQSLADLENFGRHPEEAKNAVVALKMDTQRFWGALLAAIDKADAASPTNTEAPASSV